MLIRHIQSIESLSIQHLSRSFFLAHPSQRLKCAIVIGRRPSSVPPSVRRPPSVRKLSHFQLLLPNPLMDFDETKYIYGLNNHGTLQVLLFFRPDPLRGGSRTGQK